MANRSGRIGRSGEHVAVAALKRVWPKANRSDVDKQHPTRDLAQTGDWHVQVKKRKTWNIKDVVRHMEHHMSKPKNATHPWMIVYMDSDRRKKSNPKGVYAIVPIETMATLLAAPRLQVATDTEGEET